MAKVAIQSYVQRVSAPGGPGLALANPPAVSDGGLGNALGNLSRSFGDMQQSFLKVQEDSGRAWAADATAKARLNWTDSLITRQAEAGPGAPEFTKNFIEDYDKYVEETAKNAPTPTAARFVRERLAAMRDDLGIKAISFEAEARIDYRQDQFNSGIDTTKKLMNTDPDQYQVALAEQLAIIDSSDLPPKNKSAMKQRAIDGVSQAAVWSQIQRSPDGFLNSIGFGVPVNGKTRRSSGDLAGVTDNTAFNAMPFEKRAAMLESAIKLKNQRDADTQRVIAENRKQLSDNAMKDAWSMWGDRKLTRAHIDSIKPVINDNDYKSLLVALKESQGGGVVKSDPSVYRDLQRMLDRDPEGARDFAYRQHQNGRLSNEHLSQALGNLRTQDRRDGPKTPYERSRSWLRDSMDPGPMVQDPAGRNRMADAIYDFDTYAKGGNRTEEELDKYARSVMTRYKMVDFSQTILSLPQPRTGTIPRSGDPSKILPAIANVTKSIIDRRKAGKMDEATYDDEMRIVKRWKDAATNGK